jgi:hypothetical protein
MHEAMEFLVSEHVLKGSSTGSHPTQLPREKWRFIESVDFDFTSHKSLLNVVVLLELLLLVC